MDSQGIIGIIMFVFFLLALFCIWVMIIDTRRFVVRRYSISTEKIKQNLRIIFISDLHNKEYGKDNERLLAKIQELKPDLILVGGDIMNAIPKASTEKAERFMKSVSADYPVYYALGNHEYRSRIYSQTYGNQYEKYMDSLKNTSICLLDNEVSLATREKLLVAGLTIDRKYYKRFVKRKMLPGEVKQMLAESEGKALAMAASTSTESMTKAVTSKTDQVFAESGAPESQNFKILLAHNPEYLADYADWKPDLVLCGHVHGGVARIPGIGGVIAPSLRPFPHYDGGEYLEYGTRMILSRGLGEHTIPVRLFNPGELVVVELCPSVCQNECTGNE